MSAVSFFFLTYAIQLVISFALIIFDRPGATYGDKAIASRRTAIVLGFIPFSVFTLGAQIFYFGLSRAERARHQARMKRAQDMLVTTFKAPAGGQRVPRQATANPFDKAQPAAGHPATTQSPANPFTQSPGSGGPIG